MTDDPETARQIAELSLDTRPLLVLDVDDVVLDFLPNFMRYLTTQQLELRLDSFQLNGNIRTLDDGTVVERERVSELINHFFHIQAEWQTPSLGAADAIARIAEHAEIVLLTAMPHRHRDVRRKYLDSLSLPYPLLTTEKAKGPALRQLRGEHARPIAFVDDIPHNLISARSALADAHLYNLITMPGIRALLPPLPETIVAVDSWTDLEPQIVEALGI